MAKDGVDFTTYQPGDRGSGWNWGCLICTDDPASGWRSARKDARADARRHVETHGPANTGSTQT